MATYLKEQIMDTREKPRAKQVVAEDRRYNGQNTNYIVTTTYDDGSWIKRRFNEDGVQLTIVAVSTEPNGGL